MSILSLTKKNATSTLVIVISILFLLRLPFVLKDPYFSGDSGCRLHYANRIIFLPVGNRVWLPFLQLHIHIFYKLGLPYWAFKLIPSCYFFLALLFLVKLNRRIFGQNYSGFFFTLLMLFVFAYQPILFSLSVRLYQEMLEIAFFYMLLYMGALELRKSKSLLLVASIALFVRETFWASLFVLTISNYKKILSDKTYQFSFMWLWCLVLGWFCAIPRLSFIKFARSPRWPLMIDTESNGIANFLVSLKSLGCALWLERIPLAILGLGIIWVLRKLYFRPNVITSPREEEFNFTTQFKIFSLSSIGLVYLYILLFNPWEYTPCNYRMAVFLLSHLFIWIVLFYRETFDCPRFLKILSRIILVLSLFIVGGRNVSSWVVRDYSEDIKIYSEIETLGKNISTTRLPNVCILGIPFWDAIGTLVAPTLHMNRKIIDGEEDQSLEGCDIVITPSHFNFEDEKFMYYKEIKIKDQEYSFYTHKL